MLTMLIPMPRKKSKPRNLPEPTSGSYSNNIALIGSVGRFIWPVQVAASFGCHLDDSYHDVFQIECSQS